jgi:molybdenum transport protein
MLEAETAQDALEAAQAGADQLQLDKFSVGQLRELVPQLKQRAPGLVIAATGGVKLETAPAYAQTGVDLLITSSPYHAKPADFGAKITPLG